VNRRVSLNALERLAAALVGVTARALADSAQAGDLTLAQWRTLVVVARGTGMRIGDVAIRLGVSMPSASRFVRRLERRDLVATERDATDHRATLVRATPGGVAVMDDVVGRRLLLVDQALKDADPLPAQTDAVLEAIATGLARYS
jgi:DNA-binding MarR family transcriptional regulator